MTDLLTTDHADSGEIVRLHPSIVDTEVLDARDLGKPTSNLAAYAPVPPMWALRDGPSTGEYQTYRRLGDALTETRLQQPGQPAPPRPMPAPGPPPTPAVTTSTDPLKKLLRRGRHRPQLPLPLWLVAVLAFAAGAMGGVTVLAAAVIQAGGGR